MAFHSANSCQQTRASVDPEMNMRWQGQIGNFVKINWDTAVDKCNRKMGIGAQFEMSVLKDYVIIDLVIVEATIDLRATIFC